MFVPPKGRWAKNLAIWSERAQAFAPQLTKQLVWETCGHPLTGQALKGVFTPRLKMSEMVDGTLTGVEVDVLKTLRDKYGFGLEFFTAPHTNLRASDLELRVREFR